MPALGVEPTRSNDGQLHLCGGHELALNEERANLTVLSGILQHRHAAPALDFATETLFQVHIHHLPTIEGNTPEWAHINLMLDPYFIINTAHIYMFTDTSTSTHTNTETHIHTNVCFTCGV